MEITELKLYGFPYGPESGLRLNCDYSHRVKVKFKGTATIQLILN